MEGFIPARLTISSSENCKAERELENIGTELTLIKRDKDRYGLTSDEINYLVALFEKVKNPEEQNSDAMHYLKRELERISAGKKNHRRSHEREKGFLSDMLRKVDEGLSKANKLDASDENVYGDIDAVELLHLMRMRGQAERLFNAPWGDGTKATKNILDIYRALAKRKSV